VPTKITLKSLPGTCDDSEVGWTTETSTVTQGIHVSHTMVPTDGFVDVPVRVMNARRFIHVEGGDLLG